MNRSQEALLRFIPALVFDARLDQFLAAGVQVVTQGVDFYPAGSEELAAGLGGAGAGLLVEQEVADAVFLTDTGIDVERVLRAPGSRSLPPCEDAQGLASATGPHRRRSAMRARR